MSDIQLYIAVGVPTLAVLLGILLNAMNMTSINARFNSIDARFNSIDARLSLSDARFDMLLSKIVDIGNRLSRVEERLDRK